MPGLAQRINDYQNILASIPDSESLPKLTAEALQDLYQRVLEEKKRSDTEYTATSDAMDDLDASSFAAIQKDLLLKIASIDTAIISKPKVLERMPDDLPPEPQTWEIPRPRPASPIISPFEQSIITLTKAIRTLQIDLSTQYFALRDMPRREIFQRRKEIKAFQQADYAKALEKQFITDIVLNPLRLTASESEGVALEKLMQRRASFLEQQIEWNAGLAAMLGVSLLEENENTINKDQWDDPRPSIPAMQWAISYMKEWIAHAGYQNILVKRLAPHTQSSLLIASVMSIFMEETAQELANYFRDGTESMQALVQQAPELKAKFTASLDALHQINTTFLERICSETGSEGSLQEGREWVLLKGVQPERPAEINANCTILEQSWYMLRHAQESIEQDLATKRYEESMRLAQEEIEKSKAPYTTAAKDVLAQVAALLNKGPHVQLEPFLMGVEVLDQTRQLLQFHNTLTEYKKTLQDMKQRNRSANEIQNITEKMQTHLRSGEAIRRAYETLAQTVQGHGSPRMIRIGKSMLAFSLVLTALGFAAATGGMAPILVAASICIATSACCFFAGNPRGLARKMDAVLSAEDQVVATQDSEQDSLLAFKLA